MTRILPALIFLIFIATGSAAQSTRNATLFNDNWQFHKGDLPNGHAENTAGSLWRKVDLPHDWSIEGPFGNQWASGTGFLPGGIGWYKKTFTLDSLNPGDNTFIYFDGIYKNSEVWLNGQLLGKRPNGYIAFFYDLSPYLKKENTLMVKVDHSKFADSRWYPGSGIYRNVYLIKKRPIYIRVWGVGFSVSEVTAQKANATISIALANSASVAKEVLVEWSLSRGSKQVYYASTHVGAHADSTVNMKFGIEIQKPQLWSVEDPRLYTLKVAVKSAEGKLDEYVEKVGFRDIRFDAQNGFFLNGKNTKLRGVCIHHDAGALGAAVPREVWVRRLQKMKEAGCNAIRMSHYPHQDYLYELCDEMGFLVQDEAFDEWEFGKNKWIEGWNVGKPGKDGYHEYFNEWAEKDVRDMVLRNRNHPSIIMWSIGNEIDYPNDPYSHEVLSTGRNPQIYGRGYLPNNPPASRLGEISQRLAQVVRDADSTRPVTAALAGVVMSNTTSYPKNIDLVGYNYQEYRYAEDHNNYPDRIIYGSENSKSVEAWTAVDTSKNIFGQFVWTGFDFMGEAGRWPARSSGAGLMDLAGFPKTDYWVRQTLWLDKPVIYLVANRVQSGQQGRGFRGAKPSWNWKTGDSIRVNCITNAEDAELFLNGRSLGRKSKKDTAQRGLFWIVPYEPGMVSVKGFKNGKAAGKYQLVTPVEPSKLVAVADKKRDIVQIEVFVKDSKSNPVFEASNEITVDITGPAKLLGLESGDLSSHEDYRSNKRKAYNGRLLAYVQSTGGPGEVKITFSSPGLQKAVTSILWYK